MPRALAPLLLLAVLTLPSGSAWANSLVKAFEPVAGEALRAAQGLQEIAEEGAETAQQGAEPILGPFLGSGNPVADELRSGADAIAGALDADAHACPSGQALPHSEVPWTPDHAPELDWVALGAALVAWDSDLQGFAASESACRYTQLTTGLV